MVYISLNYRALCELFGDRFRKDLDLSGAQQTPLSDFMLSTPPLLFTINKLLDLFESRCVNDIPIAWTYSWPWLDSCYWAPLHYCWKGACMDALWADLERQLTWQTLGDPWPLTSKFYHAKVLDPKLGKTGNIKTKNQNSLWMRCRFLLKPNSDLLKVLKISLNMANWNL